jgi:ribosomal protein L22
MSAEQDKDDVMAPDPAEAKKPAAKKAAKKPAKAAKGAEAKTPAKGAQAKADDAKAAEAKKPAAKKAAKKPAAAKPRRRVVRAHARYVRTSARKARMVCGHLRGKSIDEARAILAFTPREVARDWSKLLESAVANAESNHELLEDDLIVREAYADEGPTIKRFRPRAMGRATPIRKRTSHLTIALTADAAQRPTKSNG